MKRFLLILIMIGGCKEEYNPPLKNAGYNYLVVEGNILAGDDSTFVRLTRTVAVSDTSNVKGELNATVKVENENGEAYLFQEQGNGWYMAPPLNINLNENYRLHIVSSNGREYASDYVPVKQTPPIDSVSWKIDNNNGITIYTTAHDASGTTQYYRWEFTETWEHRSRDSSMLIYEASLRDLRYRLPSEQLYRCWNTNISGEILITSTAGLSADLVYEKPITSIPYASPKLSKVYSILVKQYALTKDAYEYWDNLKKNTEELGSIFDPQPFADYGNMHCITDATEPVLGYISACSVAQQRIYIKASQVQWPYYFPNCEDTTVAANNIDTVFSGFLFMPVTYVFPPPGSVFGTSPECADCRLTGGGSTVRPPYMP